MKNFTIFHALVIIIGGLMSIIFLGSFILHILGDMGATGVLFVVCVFGMAVFLITNKESRDKKNKYIRESKDETSHKQDDYVTQSKNKAYLTGDCENGYGTFISSKGDKYVGEWKDGKQHGHGTYTFDNGDKYVGEFRNGKHHGQGTFIWSSGGKYVGEWKDGKHHGQGTFTFGSGDKYAGEWKDDEMHGQGIYTFARGSKIVGEFKDGKPVE